MAADMPTPVDKEPVIAPPRKKCCLFFYLYQAFLSFAFLILLVVFIPRWFPPLGNWLFPYVREAQISKLDSQLSLALNSLKNLTPQEGVNERLRLVEEKLQERTVQEPPPVKAILSDEQTYFIEALLLCQEIDGRLLAAQDYHTPLALLTTLLKTPEEKAWLSVLTASTENPKEPVETLTANWPSWLKPLQNFFTIQPLTDKVSTEFGDKRVVLQKLKDSLIETRQKTTAVSAEGTQP